MTEQFQVAVDRAGRIDHYMRDGNSYEALSPEKIGEYLHGNERLTLRGVEYSLTEKGGLIHSEVELIPSVELGFGVRLDRGVTFHDSADGLPEPAHRIEVQDRTRVTGTSVEDGVFIGLHNVIKAARLGAGTHIANHTRLGVNVVTQPRTLIEQAVKIVVIEDSVKIGDGSSIGAGATIKQGAHLGPNTVVWPSEVVGHNARVGISSSDEHNSINKGGALIYNGKASRDNAVVG
jgi:NDP-sugar pyrophosphorylase family protein